LGAGQQVAVHALEGGDLRFLGVEGAAECKEERQNENEVCFHTSFVFDLLLFY
jgi:hypothetical protein